MGCSPSTMARADAPDSGETTAVGTVATTNEKDGNLLFCIKLRRSHFRRSSQQNGTEGSGGSGTGSGVAVSNTEEMCNQSLLNPLQLKTDTDYEKVNKTVTLNNKTHCIGLFKNCLLTSPYCHLKCNTFYFLQENPKIVKSFYKFNRDAF